MGKMVGVADLEQFGPTAPARAAISKDAARAYCRRLAHGHYENFSVVSWLIPRHLRQDFCNIYAYCRWADDLGDEAGDSTTGLRLLHWWRDELQACYAGRCTHPVFIALAETIQHFEIPQDPFGDLLTAFERDQRQQRYDTADEVRDYCRCSADPVGRLVLHLGRCHTTDCVDLSDSICTGLQLANFCQDVASDRQQRGRIYLPLETCRACGYGEEDFAAGLYNDAFRELMRIEVDRADAYLRRGWPLVKRVSPELCLQIPLFLRGGLSILEQIRKQDYDVWARRPTVSKWRKLRLIWDAWRRVEL